MKHFLKIVIAILIALTPTESKAGRVQQILKEKYSKLKKKFAGEKPPLVKENPMETVIKENPMHTGEKPPLVKKNPMGIVNHVHTGEMGIVTQENPMHRIATRTPGRIDEDELEKKMFYRSPHVTSRMKQRDRAPLNAPSPSALDSSEIVLTESQTDLSKAQFEKLTKAYEKGLVQQEKDLMAKENAKEKQFEAYAKGEEEGPHYRQGLFFHQQIKARGKQLEKQYTRVAAIHAARYPESAASDAGAGHSGHGWSSPDSEASTSASSSGEETRPARPMPRSPLPSTASTTISKDTE